MIRLTQRRYRSGMDAERPASALCSTLEYTCSNWTAKGDDFPDRFIDDATAVKALTECFVHAVGWQSLTKANYAEAKQTLSSK